MNIELKKFGTTLISRQSGKEALSAFQPTLETIKDSEDVIINFTGVITFSPSWGDEFLLPLCKKYGNKLILKNTSNSSVEATLKILEETNKISFKKIN